MFNVGDFVYSPKYHHYGLIINYNNELQVFRKETVKGQSVFKPCNIRDEELYLKFDLKSYKWFFLLRDEYLLFIGSPINNVFSVPQNYIASYNYADIQFIFNNLLSMPHKFFADLKSKHIYWVINKENNTLGLCYYYGCGESLTSRKYYKLDLKQYSLYEQMDSELLANNYQKKKKFIESMPVVQKKLSGVWYGMKEEPYLGVGLKEFICACRSLNCINDTNFDKVNNYKYLFYDLGGFKSENIIHHYLSTWVQDGDYMYTTNIDGYANIDIQLK